MPPAARQHRMPYGSTLENQTLVSIIQPNASIARNTWSMGSLNYRENT